MDETVVFFKPNIVWWKWGWYLLRIFSKGFSIDGVKVVKMNSEFVKKWYPHKVEEPYFPEIEEFMTSRRVLFVLLSGNNVTDRMRTWLGPTDPAKAKRWQLRYGMKDKMRNGFHASEKKEDAIREKKLIEEFFGQF